MLLRVIDDAPGYLKATFQGPQGSGKTYTATLLACEAHRHFGSTKPIAFFDTETGSDYVAKLIEERTGMKPLRVKTRAFSDLLEVVKECVGGASDVLLVDSITHVWRELNDAYKKKLNARLKYPKTRLDIQDIMQIKDLWQPWPDQFLMTPVHIIACGREGNEWGHEENEETGKRDLVQTGKKMKVEAEFGYEASLMVAMKAEQIPEGTVKKKGGGKEKRTRTIVNVATVLKDRFHVINGAVFEYPAGADFKPFLDQLKPEAHRAMDTGVKSDEGMPAVDGDHWGAEKRHRAILCEEIQGLLLKFYPGQTAKEKTAKAELIDRAFKTRSWTRVESFNVETLKVGLDLLKGVLEDPAAFEAELAGGELAERFA